MLVVDWSCAGVLLAVIAGGFEVDGAGADVAAVVAAGLLAETDESAAVTVVGAVVASGDVATIDDATIDVTGATAQGAIVESAASGVATQSPPTVEGARSPWVAIMYLSSAS